MSDPLIYSSPGVGIRRVARLRRVAVTVGVAYALLAVACTMSGGILVMAGFLAMFAYMGLPFLAHYQRVSDASAQTSAGNVWPGTLRIAPGEIVIDGVLRAARSDIADGWIEPFGSGSHRVVIRLRSGDLALVEVASVTDGRAVLSAIGLSADKHALRVRTAGNANQSLREMGLLASLFFMCLPLLGLGMAEETGSLLGWGAATAAAAGLVALFARAAAKPVVRVGLDGLEISRGARKRFIAVREIEKIHLSVAGVELEVARPTGPREVVVLRCWGVQQAALFARIQEIMRGFGATAASAAQLARLDRQGRDLETWSTALRRVASDDAGDYRRIGLAREDLARLLAQGDQPPERRIAAAIALASSDDPGERERVRIAARACASEDLRAVLDGIAEGEADEALVAAALREPLRAG